MQHISQTHSPLIEVAIESASGTDHERLLIALAELAVEDPQFRVLTDIESRQIVLGGASEGHLDDKLEILKRNYRVAVITGAPQVTYRETLTRRVESDYTHKKQADRTAPFARVKIVFEPNEFGKGNVFESKISGRTMPEEYISGVERGFNSVLGAGVLAGFPLVDTRATLIDAAFDDVASSALAFEIASRAAFREALQKGGSILLEPIMKVVVVTPEDYMGSVIGDLTSRRGWIHGQDLRGSTIVVSVLVPLGNMFGYANQLRSFSQGHATFTMQFDHYASVAPLGGGRPPPATAAALQA